MASQREIDAMRLAIALSARGLGTTSPNPPVGCVILDAHDEIAGTGYHQRKGEPHALTTAGSRAEGGTAVVTLEPCNHVGRTPACRQALLDWHDIGVQPEPRRPSYEELAELVALQARRIAVLKEQVCARVELHDVLHSKRAIDLLLPGRGSDGRWFLDPYPRSDLVITYW